MTQTLYEFGEFEIDCARFELRRNGPIVKLEHIPMELHILLAEKEGTVVPAKETTTRVNGAVAPQLEVGAVDLEFANLYKV